MSGNRIAKRMINHMSRQSVRASRMRNLFVMLTILLASGLLAAILMFWWGQQEQTKRNLDRQQEVSYMDLTEQQVQALEKDERIACQVQAKMGILSEMDGFSVLPAYVSQLSGRIRIGELVSGEYPEQESEIAVPAALLDRLGIQPEVGCQVTLDFYDGNTETFTVSGITKGDDSAKQFVIFFSRAYAQEGSQLKNVPWEVYAKLYGAAEMGEEECREAMNLIGSNAGIDQENIQPSRAFLDSKTVNLQETAVYGLVGLVILAACILVIYGVFYLAVAGKIRQYGQMAALGMTKKQIKTLVSREGNLLFWRSAPPGILLGCIAGYYLIPEGFHILHTLAVSAVVLGIIWLAVRISVRKPAGIAAGVSPVEALRYVSGDEQDRRTVKNRNRLLTPLSLGMMNFTRNRKKAAVTMVSLGLGGILFMAAAAYMSSFDREQYVRQGVFQNAEFEISYGQDAVELSDTGMSGLQAKNPLDASAVERIRRVEGVKNVEEIQNFGIQYDYPARKEYGNADTVLPVDSRELKGLDAYLEEGDLDLRKLESGGGVLITNNDLVEEIYGWRFRVGDKITLHYFDGSGMAEKEMEILGCLNSDFRMAHRELEGWFVVPGNVLESWLSYDCLSSGLLVSVENGKEEAVGQALETFVDSRPELTMETLAERRVRYQQSIDRIFGVISGLSVFIMMFSILSMMNTLITNIVSRKRELAMMESIGMSRRQIRKMLLGESLVLVLVTLAVTLTVGTLAGWALTGMLFRNGAFYMVFRFPAVFAAGYAGILLLVPLVITGAATRSFSKEPLVERLWQAEC